MPTWPPPTNTPLTRLPQWSLAVPALVVSGASDWADGWAARRFNQPSVIGSYLDPLADKVLICSVVGALGWTVSAPGGGRLGGWAQARSVQRLRTCSRPPASQRPTAAHAPHAHCRACCQRRWWA